MGRLKDRVSSPIEGVYGLDLATYRHLLYDNVSIQEIRAMKINQIQEESETQSEEQHT